MAQFFFFCRFSFCAESGLDEVVGSRSRLTYSLTFGRWAIINISVKSSSFSPVSVSRCFACGLLQRGRLGYVVAGRGAPARMAFVACFCVHMFSSSSLQFANLVGLFSRPEFEWEPGGGGRRKRNQGTRGAKKAADRQVLLHTFKWSLVLYTSGAIQRILRGDLLLSGHVSRSDRRKLRSFGLGLVRSILEALQFIACNARRVSFRLSDVETLY